ncbi:MAG TPA: glycine--tRNA ligase subunit beta [Allosphingosinicella sp.]|nr:glycine--tRNA ligase subunit beta [Allosphingosinicella sp.]
MTDFLLELLSEEIPARMQDKARGDLSRLFEAELGKAGLKAEAVETYATPRRLVLIARGLPPETEAVREETKGPRASAPPQALEGFLRKTGLTRDQLEERDGVLFALVEKPGRATAAVLAEAVSAIVRAFPWPKSMRWGAASASTESLRWVRPLQGVVALFGEEIVEFEIAGVHSGAATVGHRFHHPGAITIGSANDYIEKLQACHVLVDQEERKRLIREGAAAAAEAAGLALVEDEGLVAENAGLTEWPVPLLGRFDPAYLDVPPEVIQLTMRTNQKYFALTDPEGRLAPNFLCTANIEASDGGAAIVAGNERVLSARLADAKFFWEQDLEVPLEAQAGKLAGIVFHEKLGTVADKVERVAKLARWLVEEGIVGGGAAKDSVRPERSRGALAQTHHERPSTSLGTNESGVSLADLAQRAAELCKADLVTQMVGEFPELQGIIGGHLARPQGEDPAVADAIRDHYKPVGQADEVPTAPVTVAVSLADKLDTLVAFFFIDERPTGSRDPFALRRAALGMLEILTRNGMRLSLWHAITRGLSGMTDLRCSTEMSDVAYDEHVASGRQVFQTLPDFFADRLKVQQRDAGVRHDLIDAVFALGGEDDLVRLLARVRALQAFVETAEGADLLAGYKRAANILKKEGWGGQSSETASAQSEDSVRRERSRGALAQTTHARPSTSLGTNEAGPSAADASTPDQKTLSYTPEDEEQKLIAALDSAEPKARAAVEAEDFEGAMAALASLRGPVDAFFDKVTVNDPDNDKRNARLALLARMRDAVHLVADFSRIEG